MSHNQIWIVSAAQKPSLSYYMKNERQEWCPVSNDSSLSRKEYTNTSMQARAKDIVRVIGEDYNPCNRGVDIFFEGNEEDFLSLKKAIDSCFPQGNITCVMPQTRIVVAGKAGAGKTTLIEGFGKYKDTAFGHCDRDEMLIYSSAESTAVWYELPCIGFDADYTAQVKSKLEELRTEGIAAFVYCMGTTRIESVEEQLLSDVRREYPEIRMLVVLTQSIDAEQALYADQLSQLLEGITVLPVLAMDRKIRGGVIQAYGLDDMERCIFGGNRDV